MINILRKTAIGLGIAGTLAVAAATVPGAGRGCRPRLRLWLRPAELCWSVRRLRLRSGLWFPQLGLPGRR